jgi:RNase P protein component
VERKYSIRRGYLIVIAARPGIERVKSPAVESELKYIFKKLDMLESLPKKLEAPILKTANPKDTP